MANYTKATDFASKDTLLSGDPNKVVKGAEIDDEFANIQTAVNSKADTLSPTLTGVPSGSTAAAGTSTTQIATTAFVGNAITDERTATATLTNKTITGTFNGSFTGSISGNAATATKLATARTIGGVSFDGSANIDLPGVNTAGNQDTTGNAATATKLETARTIGGVSFDGSANIDLPGVNTAGNQDTSGNAATATKISSNSWEVKVIGTALIFTYNGSIVATLSSTGSLSVEGDVSANRPL